MSWQLGLSRFIHGFPTFADPPGTSDIGPHPAASGLRLAPERELQIVPAVIATLLDFDGRFGAWPPIRVAKLLDWAGSDGEPRRAREALLCEGLAVLDESVCRECNVGFESLSPVQRRDVLSVFARGELGLPREVSALFMDSLVEVAAFAFLNFELDLVLPGASQSGEAGHA